MLELGYVVLSGNVGSKTYVLTGATAYKIYVRDIGSSIEQERNKSDLLFSSLDMKACLQRSGGYSR